MSAPWGEFNRAVVDGLDIESRVHLADELIAARAKFPGNRLLLAALTEEAGELAKALLQRAGREKIQHEALQVACVAMRIYEEGDATFAAISDEEAQP